MQVMNGHPVYLGEPGMRGGCGDDGGVGTGSVGLGGTVGPGPG
jgi:hypothetical protein